MATCPTSSRRPTSPSPSRRTSSCRHTVQPEQQRRRPRRSRRQHDRRHRDGTVDTRRLGHHRIGRNRRHARRIRADFTVYVAFVAAGSPGTQPSVKGPRRNHRPTSPSPSPCHQSPAPTGSSSRRSRHHRAATSPTPPSPHHPQHLACTTVGFTGDATVHDAAFNVTGTSLSLGSTHVHVDGNVPHFKPSANVAVTVTSYFFVPSYGPAGAAT